MKDCDLFTKHHLLGTVRLWSKHPLMVINGPKYRDPLCLI